MNSLKLSWTHTTADSGDFLAYWVKGKQFYYQGFGQLSFVKGGIVGSPMMA